MRDRIAQILRTENETVSGERLSKELGISRVSIWKHIKKLQQLGYPIIASPTGYRLKLPFDALFPWEFPGKENKIHYYPETDSTMDIARELARNGCPEFTTVIAGRQNKGRGRLKREWYSSEGGLYFTLVVRPQIPVFLSSRVNFAASVVLTRTLRRQFDVDAAVKWPNDILVKGRKLSGMLSEMEAEADRVSFINIGIGINVNNDPTPFEPMACSLKSILKREVSRKALLSEFLNKFENWMKHADFEHIIDEWKTYTSTLNRFVRIVTERATTQGFAVDVDENGALVLKLEDGSIKKVAHGDCFHSEG